MTANLRDTSPTFYQYFIVKEGTYSSVVGAEVNIPTKVFQQKKCLTFMYLKIKIKPLKLMILRDYAFSHRGSVFVNKISG